MGLRIDNRVALVTGAGNGLGRAHAIALAQAGARVVVNDLNPEAVEAVVQEITALGGEAMGAVANIAQFDAVQAMVAQATEAWGAVDILVNNAGILRDKSFTKMSMDDFRLVLDVHVMGTAHCTKAVWDGMRARNYGRLIFTTSSSGLYGNFGQANYGAAKMAIVGLMQTLSIEGARYNIRSNCLAPSASTGMTQGLYADATLAELGPERVSPAVVALASDAAPNRMILLAGGGNFAQANITMTRGHYVTKSDDVAADILANLDKISCSEGEIIPQSGNEQHQQEYEISKMARAS